MKRAAMVLAVIFALLLVGYPSAPTHAGSATSSNSAATGTGNVEPGEKSGGDGDASGENEGDADGLGGIKRRSPGLYGDGEDVSVVWRTWWTFLVWLR